eukprot:g2750.t1
MDYTIEDPASSKERDIATVSTSVAQDISGNVRQFVELTSTNIKIARAFVQYYRVDGVERAISSYFDDPNPPWLERMMEPQMKSEDEVTGESSHAGGTKDSAKTLLDISYARVRTILDEMEQESLTEEEEAVNSGATGADATLTTKTDETKKYSIIAKLKQMATGTFSISRDKEKDLALLALLCRKGLRRVAPSTPTSNTHLAVDVHRPFSISIEATRKIMSVFKDVHLKKDLRYYAEGSAFESEKCRVWLVAIQKILIDQIVRFCQDTKFRDAQRKAADPLIPESLRAIIITLSRPYLCIYRSYKTTLRNQVREALNASTIWDLFEAELSRPNAVLVLDMLLPIFYRLPDDDRSAKMLRRVLDTMSKMPMNGDESHGVQCLGVVRDRKAIEYVHWKDIFEPSDEGHHLSTSEKNQIRMSKRELETSQGRCQRLFDSFLKWTIKKLPVRYHHNLTVLHLSTWQDLVVRSLHYKRRATIQRWGGTQLERIAQAIIDNLIELFGELQSDENLKTLAAHPIYRHEGVDWAHMIDLLQVMSRDETGTGRERLCMEIEKKDRFAPLVNFVRWLKRCNVVDALLDASVDEYVVKATEPFYQKLGRLDRLVNGVVELQKRVEEMSREDSESSKRGGRDDGDDEDKGVVVEDSVADSSFVSLLKLFDDSSATPSSTVGNVCDVLGADKMLKLWEAALAARRIDERRALLDCIAMLSPSCTADVSAQFLSALRRRVKCGEQIVSQIIELLNTFRSRPPYGSGESLKVLLALVELAYAVVESPMCGAEHELAGVLLTLLRFFLGAVVNDADCSRATAHLIGRCASAIVRGGSALLVLKEEVDDKEGSSGSYVSLVPALLHRFVASTESFSSEGEAVAAALEAANVEPRRLASSIAMTIVSTVRCRASEVVLCQLLGLLGAVIAHFREHLISKDIVLQLIDAAAKTKASKLAYFLLSWFAEEPSGRALLGTPGASMHVLSSMMRQELLAPNLSSTLSSVGKRVQEASWKVWRQTFVQEAVRVGMLKLGEESCGKDVSFGASSTTTSDQSASVTESASKEAKSFIDSASCPPSRMFVSSKDKNAEDELWHLAVESANACPSVAIKAGAFLFELSAAAASSRSGATDCVSNLLKRVVFALKEAKHRTRTINLLAMVFHASRKDRMEQYLGDDDDDDDTDAGETQLMTRSLRLVRDMIPPGENPFDVLSAIESAFGEQMDDSSASSSPRSGVASRQGAIFSATDMSDDADGIDDAVKALLDKQMSMERPEYKYPIDSFDASRRTKRVLYAVVVTHPNASTIIHPGVAYRIRWRCSRFAEAAYCNEQNVEIILTRNMDEEVKQYTRKFIADGYPANMARNCARTLCSQICNMCRQYITASTPIRIRADRPEGEFEWIVPTDCPEGNYFVSLRTTDFLNARQRLSWTKETTGPDAKYFVVRKAPLVSRDDVQTIQEQHVRKFRSIVPSTPRFSNRRKIQRVPLRTVYSFVRRVASNSILTDAVLDLLCASIKEKLDAATISRLWELIFVVSNENDIAALPSPKQGSDDEKGEDEQENDDADERVGVTKNVAFSSSVAAFRDISAIVEDPRSSQVRRTFAMWKLSNIVARIDVKKDCDTCAKLREWNESLRLLTWLPSHMSWSRGDAIEAMTTFASAVATKVCLSSLDRLEASENGAADAVKKRSASVEAYLLVVAGWVVSTSAPVDIVESCGSILCFALERSSYSARALRTLTSDDSSVAAALRDRSRYKPEFRLKCVKIRRRVLVSEALAALRTSNGLGITDIQSALLVGLASKPSRYACELSRVLKLARGESDEALKLDAYMLVLRDSLFSRTARLRKGPRLVDQLSLMSEYLKSLPYLNLLRGSEPVAVNAEEARAFQSPERLARTLVSGCLFASKESSNGLPLCAEAGRKSVDSCCAFLRSFCDLLPSVRNATLEELSRHVRPNHKSVPIDRWPEEDEPSFVDAAGTCSELFLWMNLTRDPFMKRLRPSKMRSKRPLGLYNLGNTCFANSVLQQLFTLPATREAVFSTNLTKKKEDYAEKRDAVKAFDAKLVALKSKLSSPMNATQEAALAKCKSARDAVTRDAQDLQNQWSALRQLQWMFSALIGQVRGPAVLPCGLISSCDLVFEHINMKRQNDCAEFFENVVQLCGVDEMCKCTVLIPRKRECGGEGGDEEGVVDEVLLARSSYRTDTQYILKVRVRPTLRESLDEIFKIRDKREPREFLDGSPKVLVLNLVRFIGVWRDNAMRYSKNKDKCRFPRLLDMSPYLIQTFEKDAKDRVSSHFRLHGVIVHMGESANSGHYFSFAEARERVVDAVETTTVSTQFPWWEFNDHSVKSVEPPGSEEFARNCFGGDGTKTQAYILIYVRDDVCSKEEMETAGEDFVKDSARASPEASKTIDADVDDDEMLPTPNAIVSKKSTVPVDPAFETEVDDLARRVGCLDVGDTPPTLSTARKQRWNGGRFHSMIPTRESVSMADIYSVTPRNTVKAIQRMNAVLVREEVIFSDAFIRCVADIILGSSRSQTKLSESASTGASEKSKKDARAIVEEASRYPSDYYVLHKGAVSKRDEGAEVLQWTRVAIVKLGKDENVNVVLACTGNKKSIELTLSLQEVSEGALRRVTVPSRSLSDSAMLGVSAFVGLVTSGVTDASASTVQKFVRALGTILIEQKVSVWLLCGLLGIGDSRIRYVVTLDDLFQLFCRPAQSSGVRWTDVITYVIVAALHFARDDNDAARQRLIANRDVERRDDATEMGGTKTEDNADVSKDLSSSSRNRVALPSSVIASELTRQLISVCRKKDTQEFLVGMSNTISNLHRVLPSPDAPRDEGPASFWEDVLEEGDTLTKGQLVRVYFEGTWLTGCCVGTVHKKSSRGTKTTIFRVRCDEDGERFYLECPHHTVTTNTEADLSGFRNRKTKRWTLSWLRGGNTRTLAAAADVILQAASACLLPTNAVYSNAAIREMAKLSPIAASDPTLQSWIASLDSNRVIISLGAMARTRNEYLESFVRTESVPLWHGLVNAICRTFETVASSQLLSAAEKCHALLRLLCDTFCSKKREKVTEWTVRRIFQTCRKLMASKSAADHERAFRILKDFVRVLLVKCKDVIDFVDELPESETVEFIEWLRSYQKAWSESVSRFRSSHPSLSLRDTNRILRECGGNEFEAERLVRERLPETTTRDVLGSVAATKATAATVERNAADRVSDTKSRGAADAEKDDRPGHDSVSKRTEDAGKSVIGSAISPTSLAPGSDPPLPPPPALLATSSKLFMAALKRFSGPDAMIGAEEEQNRRDVEYPFQRCMKMLQKTLQADGILFSLRFGHKTLWRELKKSLKVLREKFAREKMWSQSQSQFFVLWDITHVLEELDNRRHDLRTQIRVYHEFLNFPDEDGSDYSSDDEGWIGGDDPSRSGGVQGGPPLGPVSIAPEVSAYEPDATSIAQIKSILSGTASDDAIVAALRRSGGSVEVAINDLLTSP